MATTMPLPGGVAGEGLGVKKRLQPSRLDVQGRRRYRRKFVFRGETRPLPGTPWGTKEEAEIRYLDVQTESELQTREARRKWAPKFFYLSCVWLGLVALLLIMQGFRIFHLSDAVLIAAVTTTTANILGTLAVVANYMFPKKR
jgi:hypothetical protein